jgi:hypothetical protein
MKPLAEKRAEARTRNAAWAALTPEQQLASLKERGYGHTAQCKRIMKHLEKLNPPPAASPAEPIPVKVKKGKHKKGKRGDGRKVPKS